MLVGSIRVALPMVACGQQAMNFRRIRKMAKGSLQHSPGIGDSDRFLSSFRVGRQRERDVGPQS